MAKFNKLLLQVNSQTVCKTMKRLLGESLKDEETTILASNAVMYRASNFSFKLMRKYFRVPKKSYSFAFMLPIEMEDFSGLRNIAGAAEFGFISPDYGQFEPMKRVQETLDLMVSSQKSYNRAKKKHEKKNSLLIEERESQKSKNLSIRAENSKLKERFKEEKKNWRNKVREIKAFNKAGIKESKDSLEPFTELIEPIAPIAPEYQETLELVELPKFHFKKEHEMNGHLYLGNNRFFHLLAQFELIKIEELNLFFFKRREKEFSYTVKGILGLNRALKKEEGQLWSIPEFQEFYDKKSVNEKLNNHKFSLEFNNELIEVLDTPILELEISSVDLKELSLPDLAPIPSQNQAAIIAGGDSSESFQLEIEGDEVMVKSSAIKTYKSRKVLINGVESSTVIAEYTVVFSEYNVDKQTLTIY